MTNGNFPAQGQPYGYSAEQPAGAGWVPSAQDHLVNAFGHAVGVNPSAPYEKRKPGFLPADYGEIKLGPSFIDMRDKIHAQYEGEGTNVGDQREINPENVDPARTVLLGIRGAINGVRLQRAANELAGREEAADHAVVVSTSIIERSGELVVPKVSPRADVKLRNRLETTRDKVAHHNTDNFYKRRDAEEDAKAEAKRRGGTPPLETFEAAHRDHEDGTGYHETKHHRKFVRTATKPFVERDKSRRKVERLLHKGARIERAKSDRTQRRAARTS